MNCPRSECCWQMLLSSPIPTVFSASAYGSGRRPGHTYTHVLNTHSVQRLLPWSAPPTLLSMTGSLIAPLIAQIRNSTSSPLRRSQLLYQAVQIPIFLFHSVSASGCSTTTTIIILTIIIMIPLLNAWPTKLNRIYSYFIH